MTEDEYKKHLGNNYLSGEQYQTIVLSLFGIKQCAIEQNIDNLLELVEIIERCLHIGE